MSPASFDQGDGPPPANSSGSPAPASSPAPGGPSASVGSPGPAGANKTTIVAIVVAVVAVMVALLAIVTRPSATDTQPAPTVTAVAEPAVPDAQQQQPQEAAAQLTPQQREQLEAPTSDYTSLGSADAPVVMVEFSDYSCPFCARFAQETKPELVSKYVETGVLRLEWRDYPVIGEHSPLAAAAGRAAGQQGKFWEFNAAIYALDAPLTADAVMQVAAGLELDMEKFQTDLASDEVTAAIQADFELGRSLGITSTPTFYVNGTLVPGAMPVESFEQLIEKHANS